MIEINIKEAQALYNTNIEQFKEIALRAFSESELREEYKTVTAFNEAFDVYCKADLTKDTQECRAKLLKTIADLGMYSQASAAFAMCKIIKDALNKGKKLQLLGGTKYYYPVILFTDKQDSPILKNRDAVLIGQFTWSVTNTVYSIYGGMAENKSHGLQGESSYANHVALCKSQMAQYACANREIAEHFSRYFGMYLFQAMFGDREDIINVKRF